MELVGTPRAVGAFMTEAARPHHHHHSSSKRSRPAADWASVVAILAAGLVLEFLPPGGHHIHKVLSGGWLSSGVSLNTLVRAKVATGKLLYRRHGLVPCILDS